MPLTALAPAEIVAAHPNVVAAPIDGVIKDILVPPGAQVAEGTPLVTFVDTKLHNDAEVSARAKSVAEAKYFKALQSAISTQKEVQDLSIAKSELAVAEAELTYAQNMLSHAEIRAPKAGLVIYSAKSDWIGKPVAVGERVIDIADTSQVEIKIDLPVSDAIALQEGGPVKLFLDGDPLHPVEAVIDRVAYRPSTTPDHQLILRSFGRFKEGTTPLRIGLRGTARLTGEKVSLAFYLFRRPFALLRQKVGI